MFIGVHDSQAVDTDHTEVIVNTDQIAEIWQHPTLGCLIELENGQNVCCIETYAVVIGLLGSITRP
jgi:hypothetical protein